MSDLASLDALVAAVQSGAGLPEVVRAAARALDASLVATDAAGGVLAVAARSQSEERALIGGADGVEQIPLRLGETTVGALHMRARAAPEPSVVRVVATMIAAEVERLRAPERASESAVAELIAALRAGRLTDRDELIARARKLSLDLQGGGSVIVARAHPQAPTEDGWRRRVRAIVERGARAVAGGALAALAEEDEVPAAEVVVLLPGAEEQAAARAAEAVLREMRAGLAGCRLALGRSRVAADAADLRRAAGEALLAVNVAEGGGEQERSLAFEETGAYRLLLSTMSENPSELRRFFQETVAPIAAYDEQYETELTQTLDAFLEADGNVARTAERLFTHRHTIYYRLDRIRELTGLDVASTDGREKLSLGLKAMRVLGLTSAAGPASEAGAGGGRVPRRGDPAR